MLKKREKYKKSPFASLLRTSSVTTSAAP